MADSIRLMKTDTYLNPNPNPLPIPTLTLILTYLCRTSELFLKYGLHGNITLLDQKHFGLQKYNLSQ